MSCPPARMESKNSREIVLWCVMRVVAGLTMFPYVSVGIPYGAGCRL